MMKSSKSEQPELNPPAVTTGTEESSSEEDGAHSPHTGCGILGRYPVMSVLAFALAGVLVGIGLSTWEPEDPEDKATAVKWLGLIGDMFIRALKAVVLPLVFVNVILSVVDMMQVGRAGTVGVKTIGLYLFTTFLASIIGIISIMVFKGLFKTEDLDNDSLTRVQLGCNEEEGAYLTHGPDGDVFCYAGNLTEGMSSYFSIEDVDGTFVQTSSGPAELSFSDTIYDGVFGKLITSNIFQDFVDANFAAVVLFAIAMGAALAKSLYNKGMSGSDSTFVTFLKEIDAVLITLIHWIIMITPFAVFSLICSAVGSQDNLADSFSNVAYLCLAVMSGMFFHVFFVYTGIFYFVTRDNPFSYFKHILPAQTTAFACASSAATMPVTLECAESSGRVPTTIARFVIPLGATINMDGSAIYFPCACVWLAVLNGITPNFGNYVLLAILSTIGSAGTAPVPSAGLVMVLTAYNSVFGTTGIPDGFEFVVAIDWFLDRLQTVVNVSGDTIVAASIAHMVKLEGEHEIDTLKEGGDPDFSIRTKRMSVVDSNDGSNVEEEEEEETQKGVPSALKMPDFSV
ncbi:Putative sodium-dependent excitatory amino acid transporter glt [Seminavis robusta]|uniref:Amino acid transporter n=1 Tax=Seminavis robusta TaxID=568900 RepID=A0A9N8DAV1_9STRA|nr:Putative sodium-dependent excitatory amino acid transporter glt [Seminavis robusta]|eukprot:Sro38_g023870.1 Putative sodium-dependent excitatory amino acid transporter glt (570) ;mRNA; f:128936-130850